MKLGPSNTKSIWFALLCCCLLPLLILGWIWIPEFQHFYAGNERIEDPILEQARQAPSDAVLRELRTYRLLYVNFRDDSELIATAENLLHGYADVPGYASVHIHVPFSPRDLEKGGGMWRLQFSGLLLPQILLDAYQLTGREEFWTAARDSILAWANYDRSAWINKGALWDDHALVLKVQTLADFWLLYRKRRDFKPEVARTILQFAARTGERLVNPAAFNFASNHGVMQNVGIWHLCIAFPFLPRVQEYKQIALARMTEQMGFYVSSEGVVLEHSAAYNELGLRLLGMGLRYANLLNLKVPADWSSKYSALKLFYAEMQRPDGTIPRLGDTLGGPAIAQLTQVDSHGRAAALVRTPPEKPSADFQLFPVSAYAVAWDGLPDWPGEEDLSQTVLTWSYFEGHPHKHADELSVIFWAAGLEWWTNAGYWSYDDPDNTHAACWEGSNAPHLSKESCRSVRRSSLVSSFHGQDFWTVEAERWGPGNLTIRRQVLHLSPKIWVVIDSSSGSPQAKLQTIWTTQPDILIDSLSTSDGYTLSAPTGQHMRTWLLGPSVMSTRMFRGSRDPFAGWLSLNGEPRATDAILTEQPSEQAWAASIWALDPPQALSPNPQMLQWRDAEHWRLSLPSRGPETEVSRNGSTMSYRKPAALNSATIQLIVAPDVSRELAQLRNNFYEVGAKYPRFRELQRYKMKVTYVTLLAFVFQGMFLLVQYRRTTGINALLAYIAVLLWMGWWGWLRFFYFFSS